jgi:hypothetical protein
MPHFASVRAGKILIAGSDCAEVFWGEKFLSGSHRALIRVYDAAGNVIETHEHAGDFKEAFCSSIAK